MGDWDGVERRKHKRLSSDELVSFTLFGRSASLAQAGEVSLGGLRFTVVGCPLQCDELVIVSFNVGEQTVEAVGRVVWTNERDAITLEAGLEFVRIDPWAARLLEEEERRRAKAAAQTAKRSS